MSLSAMIHYMFTARLAAAPRHEQACDEALKQRPEVICQQASLQTAHYPVPDATTRDLVGDWLFGPLQHVPKKYSLADAEQAYQAMKQDIVEIGPMTSKSESTSSPPSAAASLQSSPSPSPPLCCVAASVSLRPRAFDLGGRYLG